MKQASQSTKTKKKNKEQLIKRLLAKSSLDFKCCGHGGDKGDTKK